MQKTLLLLTIFCFLNNAGAQNDIYAENVKKGESLLEQKQYIEAAKAYTVAFESFQWRGYTPDRLNAARAWSMAGVPDSAFFNLFRIAEKANYDKPDDLLREKQFGPLRKDPRWSALLERVRLNMPSMPELAKILEEVYTSDQSYRLKIDSVQKAHGPQSPQMEALWRTIDHHDSINEAIVTRILDEHGWLGREAVGATGNTALFLVIQHAPLKTQEKYLEMMRDAVKNGRARSSSLALLEDRILIKNGKKQLYGSQVYTDPKTGESYFFAIEEVDNVDQRRAMVGLQPLAEYAKHFGFEWNAEALEKNRTLDAPAPEQK